MRPVTRAFASVAALMFCAPVATMAQEDTRVVALVVTAEEASSRADAFVRGLRPIGAEILRASAPSDAELRAVMRRFSKEAAAADAATVFIDLPVVSLDGRAFVLEQGETLSRATDLFTEAVPLRAFARMTALAERGGAVLVSAQPATGPLPEGVVQPERAPIAVQGTSEILFAPADVAIEPLATLDTLIRSEPRVDLADFLVTAALQEGVSLSAPPETPIILKEPATATPDEDQPEIPEASVAALTTAELEILEQSLSPAARRNLQRALRSKGFYTGLIDGIIGDQTRTAIVAFQAERAAPQTGLLTPREFQELLAIE